MSILLDDWQTSYGLPPFDQISDDQFEVAFETALGAALGEIDAIAGDTEPPSFENTIDALERAGEQLGRVLGAFYAFASTDSNPAREALQRKFSPRLAAYSSQITMNSDLFQRIKTVWEQKDSLELSEEQARVLMLTHRNFVRDYLCSRTHCTEQCVLRICCPSRKNYAVNAHRRQREHIEQSGIDIGDDIPIVQRNDGPGS